MSDPPQDTPAPHHDVAQPRVLTADARAAAAVLTSGDPDVVVPGTGPLLTLARWWGRGMSKVRSWFAQIGQRLAAPARRWPLLAGLVHRYRRMMDEAYRQQAALAAAGAAFWLVISVFPAMIAAVNVFGLVVEPTQVVSGLYGMTDTISGGFGKDVARQLEQVAAVNNRALSIGLVVSVAVSLWSMSAGLAALTRAIRQAFGLRPLTFLELRRRSYVAALFVVVVLGIGIAFAAAEAVIVDVADRAWLGWAVTLLDLPAAIVVVAFAVTALYRLAIGKRIKWRPLVPGVVFATVGLIAIGIGYSTFLDFFTERYSAVYGAVAGTVLALLLAYIAVYVVVLGAIVNAQHLADQRAHDLSTAGSDPHETTDIPPPRSGADDHAVRPLRRRGDP